MYGEEPKAVFTPILSGVVKTHLYLGHGSWGDHVPIKYGTT